MASSTVSSAVPSTILVVDDRVELAENIAEILSCEGYAAEIAESAESALERASRGDVSLVITDYRLPGKTGVDLITELQRAGLRIPAIVMSAHTDPVTVELSQGVGAFCFVAKPIDFSRMLGCLSRALNRTLTVA